MYSEVRCFGWEEGEIESWRQAVAAVAIAQSPQQILARADAQLVLHIDVHGIAALYDIAIPLMKAVVVALQRSASISAENCRRQRTNACPPSL